MKRFINRVEKYLIRFIVLGVIALVIIQGLLTDDSMRFYLSLGEKMEGQVIELPDNQQVNPEAATGSAATSPYASLTFSIKEFSSLPRAQVLVNGERKAEFNNSKVNLTVMGGDIIEIDSSAYNFPVEYVIEKGSANLGYPRQGQTFTGNQSIVMIGKIIVK